MDANEDVNVAPLSNQPAPPPAASPAASLPSPGSSRVAMSLIRRLWESQVSLRQQKIAMLVKAFREKRERPVALAASFDAEIARLDIEIQAEEERIRRIRRDRLQTASQAARVEADANVSGSVWGMSTGLVTL